jgi:nicotinamide mononucleotide transporter
MPDINDIKRELEDIYKDYEQQVNPNSVNSLQNETEEYLKLSILSHSEIVSLNHEQLNIVPYTFNILPYTVNIAPEPINPKKTFNKYEYLILFILSIIFIIFSFIDVTPGNEISIISIDNNSNWQKTLYVVSGLASFTGILSVVLSSKEHRYAFIYGFINCVTFGIYAFAYGYAGNFQLNMFYLPLQIWGYLQWSKDDCTIDTKENNIKVLKIHQKVIYVLVCFAFWYIFYFEIPEFTKFVTQFIVQQEYPYESNIVARILDSGIVSISIIAQYLLIKKYYECWILWTIVNIFNIIMFSGTLGDNNFISVNIIIMTTFYQLNVFYGFYLWTHKLSTQNIDNLDNTDNPDNQENTV